MKLSLVIPVFNTSNYIRECLESIIKEDLNDEIEIIIVNDGSTDDSLAICEKYQQKNQNIKIFNNLNHGVSYSRNYGINRAQGEWIMFVDSDDKLIKGWYSIVKKCFDSNKDIVVFANHVEDKNDNNYILEAVVGMKNNELYLSSPWSKLYNGKFLRKNGIKFDEKIINGEDMLFNIKCFLNTKQFIFRAESIYRYRIHMTSATKKFNKQFLKSDLLFQEKLLQLLEENEMIKNKKKIISFCKKNSIFVIAQRLCYTGDYKILKDNKEIFIKSFKEEKEKTYIGIKKEIVIILLKCKLYLFVFIIFSLMRNKINNKIYFINI